MTKTDRNDALKAQDSRISKVVNEYEQSGEEEEISKHESKQIRENRKVK